MNILLVCDDEKFSNNFAKKLVFLRKDDNICKTSYKDALNDLIIYSAQIAIICSNNQQEKTIKLISKIRENSEAPIVLVCKIGCEQEFILSAYDAGISDFVFENIPDYELVIRIISNLKHNDLKTLNIRYAKVLEQLKVIDSITGIYNNVYAKQVIENYIDMNFVKEGSFMIISPSNESKLVFSSEKLSKAIKSSIRNNDILMLGSGINFYIFMPNTDINGAVVVYNKIKSLLDFEICAGISDISGKSFKKFEHDTIKALTEGLTLNKEYSIFQDDKEETLDDWLEDKSFKNKSSKDYRLFRQMFNKKLEKVITPIFYRLQKTYEEKLFNTEIEQYITEDQCVFNLKSKKGNGSLKIIYPGFAKITILISFEGLESPENKEIKLPLAKITQKELVGIIEDFIKEYKENVIG